MSIEPSGERDFGQLAREVIRLLEAKGERMVIPDPFKAERMCAQWNIPVREIHKLTGMSKLTDELREALAVKLKDCVLNSKPFLIVHVDADNLKLANSPRWGHWFGNICIQRSAMHTANIAYNAIQQIDRDMQVMIAIPSETAADDLLLVFFPKGEGEIDSIIKTLDAIDTSLSLDDARYKDYFFSSSHAQVRNSDEILKPIIDEEIAFWRIKTNALPHKLLDSLLQKAENRAHFYKEVKSILEFPDIAELLQMNEQDFEDAMVVLKKDKRGVEAVERIINRLTRWHERLQSMTEQDRNKKIQELKEGGLLGLFPEIKI